MDITDFLKRSNEFGLGRVANPIADLARQCIRIGSKPKKDHDVDVGESKLGGDPDVPDDFAWPSWQDVKLAFLIQINLSEIAGISPAINLPERGMLSFFYHPDQATWGFDPKDRGSWRTYFFSDTSKLRRMSTPKLNGNYVDKFYNSCSLSFNVDTSYPYPTSDFIRELNLIKEEQNAYWDFYDSTKFSTPEHQLLGYPSIIQNPMEIECQFVTSGVYLGDSNVVKAPKIR